MHYLSTFKRVNEAMDVPPKFKQQKKLNLGILDIYGKLSQTTLF